MIGYVLLGMLLTHVFWAAVFVGWWILLIKRSDEDVQQAIRDDFKAVRDALTRAAHAKRN